ncbi:MAG: glycerate kinase type-2 family protein [Paracoccaceae bacterium]
MLTPVSDTDDRALLVHLFETAVKAADPVEALRPHLPKPGKGRTVVIGAGKGAAQMAAAFETLWDGPLEGVVVTRYGYGAATETIRVLEAAHPVPDAAGLAAAQELTKAVHGLTADDLVVALICGGGSSLLPAPPDGLSLEDEQSLNQALLASGAPISVMNAIRKQVSQIKGGRLAAMAHPARVVSLVVSDVPGDDPAQVASGPTVPDASDRATALASIHAHRIALPDAVRRFLETAPETTPNPQDTVFATHSVSVVASARLSLEAAASEAEKHGVTPVILSDAIEGEARDIGMMHAAIAREVRSQNRPFPTPTVILSGGETTVTIRDTAGRGGRNTEFLLAFAGGVEGLALTAMAADTDGIDGSESNAGAFANGQSWERLRAIGHDPSAILSGHDAWTAFEALGDLFAPGPTGTNVNDFRAILIR